MNTATDTPEQDAQADASAPTPKAPSPLDQAIRSSRARHADPTSLFLAGEDVVTMPSVSLNPGVITRHATFSEDLAPVVQGAVNALEKLHDATAKAIAVRQGAQQDPTLTPAAAVLLIDDSYTKLMKPATTALDAARANIEQQITSTKAALDAPVKAGAATGQFASEVRAVIRALPPAERMAAVQQAVASGDVTVATAVLGAPPLLSGLSAEQVTTLTAQHNRLRNPEQVKRLALLEHAHAGLEQAGRIHMRSMESVMGVRLGTVQKVRAATTKARAVIGAIMPAA